MFRSILLTLAFFAACNVCLSDDEISARLLISKQILNKYLVEKSDLLVRYTIYNVGNGAATNVNLIDNGFHTDAFEIVGGQPSATIERLAPHANYTHVLVVRPKHYGYFNFTAAEVSYKPVEEVEKVFCFVFCYLFFFFFTILFYFLQIQLAFSSEPGEGGIVNLSEFNKRFSSHLFDWLAFGIMTVPSLAIPFALWHMSKSKYERYGGKHKKH